jgi:hypothetical protein
LTSLTRRKLWTTPCGTTKIRLRDKLEVYRCFGNLY